MTAAGVSQSSAVGPQLRQKPVQFKSWRRTFAVKTDARSARCRAGAPAKTPFPVPRDPAAAVAQAQEAVVDAFAGGKGRQRLDLLLPLIGATEIDDWPGGIQQQFKAALPMVEKLLVGVRDAVGLSGQLQAQVLDQGDACVAWVNDRMLAVLFPTGDVLNQVEDLAKDKELVMIINPQWSGGQVISDFGLFGRKRKEEFVGSFTRSYSLESRRMMGEDMRCLRIGDEVQLFVREGRDFTFVDSYPELPAYNDLEAILQARPGSIAAMSLIERMQNEAAFNADSIK